MVSGAALLLKDTIIIIIYSCQWLFSLSQLACLYARSWGSCCIGQCTRASPSGSATLFCSLSNTNAHTFGCELARTVRVLSDCSKHRRSEQTGAGMAPRGGGEAAAQPTKQPSTGCQSMAGTALSTGKCCCFYCTFFSGAHSC